MYSDNLSMSKFMNYYFFAPLNRFLIDQLETFPCIYIIYSVFPQGFIRGIVNLDNEKHLRQFKNIVKQARIWLMNLEITSSIAHFKEKYPKFIERNYNSTALFSSDFSSSDGERRETLSNEDLAILD